MVENIFNISEKYYSELSQKAAELSVDNYYRSFEYPSNTKRVISNSEDIFFCGAEWQRNNLWIRIDDRDNVIPNDKDVLIRMSNGEVRRYNEDWESEFALDGTVTHWMPIPKIDNI